eukprot:Skav215740  [mRNA]  locus=scaffold7226:25714:29682:- [translate_table: standard]
MKKLRPSLNSMAAPAWGFARRLSSTRAVFQNAKVTGDAPSGARQSFPNCDGVLHVPPSSTASKSLAKTDPLGSLSETLVSSCSVSLTDR